MKLVCILCSAWVSLASVAASDVGSKSWVNDLTPITAADWNYDRAAHLLERAGFGGSPEEIETLVKLGPRDAVRRLVYYQDIEDVALPKFVETGIYPSENWSRVLNGAAFQAILFGTLDKLPTERRNLLMSDERTGVLPEDKRIARTGKQAVVDRFYYFRNVDILETQRAQTWLVDRILKTRRSLQEKLALFWHGHFATSNEKIRDYRKMLGQFSFLRENANGNFRDLLTGIGKDPAMLVYLDNHQNLKGHPNENYAREILELFSLGVGNYTETDIRETARALTGWTLNPSWTRFANRPEMHDDGEKTVLGRKGAFKPEDVVDIILEQPACSRFMSRKLYRFSVREEINQELEEKLSASLKRHNFGIAPFLEEIFLSRDFYSVASYATQIKSPVQLVVSTYMKLGLKSAPTYPKFSALTAGLGQEIFYPPNVKGWDGGKTWINPATIFQRQNVARYILFPEEAPVIKNAHLEGTRRLTGDFIFNQFMEMAERGNYTDFPKGETMSMGGAGDALQADAYQRLIENPSTGNETLDFLTSVSKTALDSSRLVRETIGKYSTPAAYGSTPLATDLRKVAALIHAGFPTRVYYVSLSGFDTHASQTAGRFYLLTGLGEALRAFFEDVKRIGRASDVVVMMFSEFGRRVEENASGGTDHGTAGPMFVMGAKVKAGLYGKHPSLTDLDESGDLKMTTDFRRVYATMLDEWMGRKDIRSLLRGDYSALGVFS